MEKLARSFQNMMDRIKVYHPPRKNWKDGNDWWSEDIALDRGDESEEKAF